VLWGAGPWAGSPWGSDAPADLSTPPPFETLPLEDRIYVARLRPYDPTAGVLRELLYSDRPWEAGDEAVYVRMLAALEIESAMPGGFGRGDVVVPRIGGIVLHPDEAGGTQPVHELGASDLDPLTGYRWDGRAVEVLGIGPTFALSQGQAVFSGFSEDATWDRSKLEVIVRDPAQRLRKPIQPIRFAGTGGLEGGDDLKGKTKPLVVGFVRNFNPGGPVDRTNDVYQVNVGETESIVAAYDKGVALTYDGDITTLVLADVYAWTPVSGHWISDLANGVARLGAPPQGTVTFDVEGDADASLGGYVESAADIAERIFRRGGFSAGEIDSASVAAVNAIAPGRCGLAIAIGEGEAEIPGFLSLLFPETVAGFWELTRTGLARVVALQFTAPVRTISQGDFFRSPNREATEPPVFRHRLGYGKAWLVQATTELATLGVTDAHRDFVGQEYRYPDPSEDVAVEAVAGLPGDFTGTSLFADESDAEDEQDRRLAITKLYRDTYECEFSNHQFLLRLGDTVRVEWPQWGLGAGRDFIVRRLLERTDTRRTTAELWG
jgi:hypothetical protein